MSEQNINKDSIDAIIANTSIHDCDDSTYEVHVSAATLHLLSQLRENLTKGLNIYSLIEATMLKYAESHATKDFMLVKSSQAYKQLNEVTTKEMTELRQLVEVLKKENEELRNELNALRDKDSEYILKEAPSVEHSSEHTVTISDEDVQGIRGNSRYYQTTEIVPPLVRDGIVVENDPVDDDIVENEPIVINTSDIPHSSEDTVTLSDEDVKSIKGNGTINTIKGKGFDTSISFTHEKPVKHPNPNGIGGVVYVSTGKPDGNSNEKIRVTNYSEIEDTKM